MRSSWGRVLLASALAGLALLAYPSPNKVPSIAADETMVHMIDDCTSSYGNSSCQYSFFPTQTTLPAGSVIDFMNLSSVAHTATSDTGAFDTGVMAPNAIVSITFSRPGTYPFHCSIHPNMHATIVITAAAPTAAPTAPPAPTSTPVPPATSTPVPTSTPQPTAIPLAVHLSLSPKRINPGQKLRVAVRTLPAADLVLRLSRPGSRQLVRRGQARGDGSYATTIAISKTAKPGKLTVRVTASMASQTVQAVAVATIQ